MNFWDFVGFFFWSYVFIAYLIFMISIIGDIIRDQQLNGWMKAIWIICLVFLPFITAFVYLIARGSGMRERQFAAERQARSQADAYIRSVANDPSSMATSPVDEINKAKTLLDAGAISQSEFQELKEHALAGSPQPSARRASSVSD